MLRVSFVGEQRSSRSALAGGYPEHGSADRLLPDGLPSPLGLGTGAVFKFVAEWFPGQVGAVTGVVGAAGGLGGFFPPLVMGTVKSVTGNYVVGFVLLSAVAAICLAVLARTTTAPRPELGRDGS